MILVFFIILLTGCDRWPYRRIDLVRPTNVKDISEYEGDKIKILSIVDQLTPLFGLECKKHMDTIRYCEKKQKPDKLFVFESEQAFTTCYVAEGVLIDDDEYLEFLEKFEKLIYESIKPSNIIDSKEVNLLGCGIKGIRLD